MDSSRPFVVHAGDCRNVLRTFAPDSIDAVVSDPPYGLGFMGKEWDYGVPGVEFWLEAFRVLKPGAHLVAFGGTRTYHRLTCAIEDAGFEIRDCLSWLYGQGFPKSHNGPWGGTALKPAWEPIILARKPLVGTVAKNVQEHGTGALNIDGCRIEGVKPDTTRGAGGRNGRYDGSGRWPANVVLNEDAAAALDEQSGELRSGGTPAVRRADKSRNTFGAFHGTVTEGGIRWPKGGASRFFYCAKASRAEREAGLREAGLREAGVERYGEQGQDPEAQQTPRVSRPAFNNHPTVKPLALMRWLVKLVTPVGGVVLDPFTGSGSTGCAAVAEGFRFVGIEKEPAYVAIAEARIAHALASVPAQTEAFANA